MNTKAMKETIMINKPIVETASDTDTSDSDIPNTLQVKKPLKKTPIKKEVKKPEPAKVESDSDSDSDSDEEKEMKAKKRDKKHKESYKELFDRIKDNHTKNIDTTKHIGIVIEGLTKLFKESKARDKENEKLLEHLSKTHSDDMLKAANSRPKRGGNSGFKAKELPEYLLKFLRDNGQMTSDETALANPKVLSKLNTIFTERNLRKGKTIYLDKNTRKELNLSNEVCIDWNLYDDEEQVPIKFERFGKFVSRLISSFKPQEVPTYLYDFLKNNGQASVEKEVITEPQVLKKLEIIFTNRKLKNGTGFYLDKDTLKDLNLTDDVIKRWKLYDDDKQVKICSHNFEHFVNELINRK